MKSKKNGQDHQDNISSKQGRENGEEMVAAVVETETAARGLGYMEIALIMMIPGQGIPYLEGHTPSKVTLVKAYFELKKRGADKAAKQLKVWTDKIHPAGKQGRNAPKVGDRRTYRVQRQQGLDFVRVPVAQMGLAKGDRVLATFKAGEISLVKCPDAWPDGSGITKGAD